MSEHIRRVNGGERPKIPLRCKCRLMMQSDRFDYRGGQAPDAQQTRTHFRVAGSKHVALGAIQPGFSLPRHTQRPG
jgi:hypothetical protein